MMIRRAGTISLLLTLSGAAALHAQVTFVPDQTPRITVDGHAAITERPDVAVVSFGVYALNQDLRTAKASVDAAIGRLIKLAETLHIDTKDVSASSLNVASHYSEEKMPKFVGYEVTRIAEITLRDLARLDELIDGAIQAGANRDFNISLKVSTEAALRERAVMLALEDAKTRAARMAGAVGLKLGAVRSISPGSRSTSAFSVGSLARGIGAGTYLPSSITITVTQ